MTNLTLIATIGFNLTTNWQPVAPTYSDSWPELIRSTNYFQKGAVYSNEVVRFELYGEAHQVTVRSNRAFRVQRWCSVAEPWKYGEAEVLSEYNFAVPTNNTPQTTLVPLQKWNQDQYAAVIKANTYPKPNGIACPTCGGELNDTDSGVLTSYPAQANVGCPKCGYKGYRIY